MKRLVVALAVAFVFSTTAIASDIAYYIGPYNPGWYGDEQFEHVDTAISMTAGLFKDVQKFDDTQFDDFTAWIEANTDDGEMDIIWLNGTMPSVLYQFPNVDPDGSPAETWLDNGNMIINVGDWFAYMSYEGGSRSADNGGAGAANILDLASGVIASADGTALSATAAGREYLPSIGDSVETDRPVILAAVVAPWEVAEVFAQNAAGTQADPVVIHNTETGGYLAIINQDSGSAWLDDRGVTTAEFIINWVAVKVGLADPSKAAVLSPGDGAVDVPPDALLEWFPGATAATHDVYFGTSFDDVNTASRSNPMGVLASQNQTATTFDPEGVYEFGTTYYWRVDEVNGAPDNTIFKGETWSFTAEPFAYPIANVIATSNAISEPTAGPENTVNGSGLNEMDQHSTSSGDMWLGTPAGADPTYIQFEFDQVYKLHELLVWNYNVQFELILGFGLKDVTVEYSVDGENWAALGDAVLSQATAKATYTANTTIEFGGVAAKYVRLTINSGYGMMGQYGLSEVRFTYIPASAREPEPGDGDTGVSVATTLSWRAGRDAVSHEVAIGTDAAALPAGVSVSTPSYDPGALDLATTYYWQVNAVQDTESWLSPVWSFTTQAYLVVDDFESYDDEENRIYDSWLDGWVNDTGSTVGYLEEPFAEQTIVHGGGQSMPLQYDNAGVATSEAEFDLSQNWSANGIQGLSLYFHGDAGNSGGQLYVKINNAKILYDGSAANLADPGWHLWSIDLATAGNVSNVTSMVIGIEGAGASGILYIDDIRLYPEVLAYHKFPDVTAAGDTVVGVPDDGDWPAAETPELAIDNNVNTKYLHRKGGAMPTGFQVTPAAGATIVTGLTFTTANDVPTRDPISFELSGSNTGIGGPYELIAAGDIVDFAGATAWPRFTKNATVITFDNDVAYTNYQIVFPTLRGESETLMQIAEVEFIGTTP